MDGREGMSEYPLVSIVVLNYNGMEHLKTCLDSLLKTNYPNFEIILVDNNSSDDSVNFVEKNYPQVRIVRLRRNVLTAAGYMAGALAARGKYIAILNNDIEVDPNWLRPMVELLEKAPWIAAADPKFKSFYDRSRFEDSAAAGRWLDYFGNNYTRGVNEVDEGQYDKPVYIMGVLTLFRRDVFFRVGGFDVSYIYGYEDMDIGWRLYLAGYKVAYVPQAVIYHKSGASTREKGGARRPRPELYYLNKRNRLISILKNYSLPFAILAFYVTILEYVATALYLFLTGNKVYGLQIVRSIVGVLRRLRKVMASRAKVQALRRRSDREVRRYMVPYSGDVLRVISTVFSGRRM